MNGAWMAYRCLAAGAGAIAPAARLLLPQPERSLWPERLGRVPAQGPVEAWIHAASMGEAVAASALADALLRRAPAARLHFTATTRTGRARLAARGSASLAPLDTPQAAECFVDRLRPRRLFVLETELWPHWLLATYRHAVPTVAISARLSARSLHRLSWLGEDLRRLVSGLEGVLCHTEGDRQRWIALGARPGRTVVVGNLKLDALPVRASDPAAQRRELGLEPGRPLLVLASLRPGEARPLAAAWAALPGAVRETWQVVAVPRHADAAASLRSETTPFANAGADAWRWDERAGVLAGYYSVADAAFVGGTLVPVGGHNPLEPAGSGVPVLVGPHTGAQQAAVDLLAASGGLVRVDSESALRDALAAMLSDPAERACRGEAARRTVDGLRGVASRAVDRLVEWKLWPVS